MVVNLADSPPIAAQEIDIHAALENTVTRTRDERLRNILQMAFAALNMPAIQALQRELDRMPKDSKFWRGVNLPALPRQLAGAASHIAALDLDRLSPLRILGLGRNQGPMLFCAKAFRHDVVATYPSLDSSDRLMQLYGIARHPRRKGSELPDGPFQLVCAGPLAHGSIAGWREFLQPLVNLLPDGGRVFLTLAKQPMPEKQFDPDAVCSMFERVGATVSRKALNVIIEKDQIGKLLAASTDSGPAARATPSGRVEQAPGAPGSERSGSNLPSRGIQIGIVSLIATAVAAAAYWFIH